MASWNSIYWELAYQILGWSAFISWSLSSYPQALLNFKRKSVVGLSFDFLVFSMTKQSYYLIYNAVLYFSSVVQRQYYDKYGPAEMIPVAANDVAFSTHAVLLTIFKLYQVLIYDRGTQQVSKTCTAITAIVCVSAFVCLVLACQNHSWLWLISVFNTIQVLMTAIKYTPQAIMNFRLKSTIGWSVGNVTLDLLGGVLIFGQMFVQSVDQGTWVNFYGNTGKTFLSLETVFFDLIFLLQHYMLYPEKKGSSDPGVLEDSISPLIEEQERGQQENSCV